MATGKDAAFGFAVWDKLIRTTLYAVPTDPTINISPQDVVVHGGNHVQSAKAGGVPTIEDGDVPDGDPAIVGAVLECFDENLDPILYIPVGRVGDGTVAGFVTVADSPDQLFVVQEDSEENAITAIEGGQSVDIISVDLCAPNTTTGRSTQELDSSTAGTGVLQCKLIQPHPDDTIAANYCRYVVQLSEHYNGDSIAGLTD